MRRVTLVVCAAYALGCDPSGTGDTDGGGPAALVVGPIDTATYCNVVGVIEVVMRATQVGCEDPAPAPCTLPSDPVPIDGDRLTCPATDPSVLLGVELGNGGRYAVEAVARLTTTEEQDGQCYALPGAAPPLLVTTAEVDAGAHIMVEATGSPCP